MSRLKEYLDKVYDEELLKPNLDKPAFRMNPKMAERVEQGRCAECGSPIREDEFTSERSKREYSVSGLCQSCQDEIWGED